MSKTFTRDCLSERDREVLDSIFNPLEYTFAHSGDGCINADAADLIDTDDQDQDNQLDVATLAKVKELELKAIHLTEQDQKLAEALQAFNDAIILMPTRPSLYNNRAQALRLHGKDSDAMLDLNKAIELSTNSHMKTKCHALCQRGVLYRKLGDLDAARKDFEEATNMGSNFAKTQLVEINPYAALCNQMLRQAFDQLQ